MKKKRIVTCPECKGIGWILNNIFMDDKFDEPMECPRCKGKGKVKLKKELEAQIEPT